MLKKVVWKYQIPIEDKFSLEMPFGSEVLYFDLQYGIPTIWVLVESSKEMIEKRFRLAGTGHDIVEGRLKYIGTIKMINETVIYHLFEY